MMKKRIPKAGNDVRSEISKADIGGPVSLNELNNDIAKTPKQLKNSHNKYKDYTPARYNENDKKHQEMSSNKLPLPNEVLLNRLASGQKGPIDKKAMKKLTNKNYEKLPEVKKKKEDAKKAEEYREKQEKAKQFQKDLDARLKQ